MPTKRSPDIPRKNLKVLFALNYNQCSFPGCDQAMVAPLTSDASNFDVRGQICHIVSPRQHGPRANTDLTQEQLRHPNNLIVLCRNHHHEIDANPKIYTVSVLRKMKRDHEVAVRHNVMMNSSNISTNLFSLSDFPTDIIDKRVEDDTRQLHKQSFYGEFDAVEKATDMYRLLQSGDLSFASREVKSAALATIATVLDRRDSHALAIEVIDHATELAKTQEAILGKAIVTADPSTKSDLLEQLRSAPTPAVRSAEFLVIAKTDGSNAALDWYTNGGLHAHDLDPEGQLILCTTLLRSSSWDNAIKTAVEVTKESLDVMPVLNHVVAMIYLVSAVPCGYRRSLIDHFPLQSQDYPLSDTPEALAHRRAAVHHFKAAASAAAAFGLGTTSANDERYAIWLQLSDVATEESGRSLLRERLSHFESALPFIQLGVEFSVLEDLDAAQAELQRHLAVKGSDAEYFVATSLSILFKKGDPARLVTFIDGRFEELLEYVGKSALTKMRILALSSAGRHQHAADALAAAPPTLLTRDEKDQIAAMIRPQSSVTSELEALKAKYESSTGNLNDLRTLVAHLEETENWLEIRRYGSDLLEETQSARDATRLAYAYYQTNQPQHVIDVVRKEESRLPHSSHLRLLYSWALHSTGEFQESREQLRCVAIDFDDRACRRLRVELDISSGSWDNLHEYIQHELTQVENRNAEELAEIARLAAHIGNANAISLVRSAARKAPDDPNVLVACNALAFQLGHEDDPEISEWLHRTIQLSQPDGPLKILSIDDFAAYHHTFMDTEWRIRELLLSAKIPIFLAAYRLQSSVMDYTLLRAIRNTHADDIRSTFPIPAYAPTGVVRGSTDIRIVGLDATALLSLAYFEILDTAIGSFEKIIISSSMFEWLFSERAQARFRQPSLLNQASQLLKLYSTARIDRIGPQIRPSQRLVDKVGIDLATLLSKARVASRNGDDSHIVIHPGPFSVGSSDDESGMAQDDHHTLLTSCSSVVTWLAASGHLPQHEANTAQTFLKANEEPSSSTARITKGSHLYLSNSTIMYLHRLQLLDKLARSGVTLHVSRHSIDEARWILSRGESLDTATNQIDKIRSSLAAGIDTGVVRLAKRTMLAKSETGRLVQHPNVDLMSISEGADAIVCDDRVCNKYSVVERSSTQVPILNTLDLLDTLVQNGHVTDDHRDSLRTKVRLAGFALVPVTEDELCRFLKASHVEDGRLIEIAELGAIRRNMQIVRLHRWYYPPVDQRWLESTFVAVARAMIKLWSLDSCLRDPEVYSVWLIQQFNVRHYGHFFRGDEAYEHMRDYEVNFFSEILYTAQTLPPSQLTKFLSWFDVAIVKPLQATDDALFRILVERQMTWLSELVDQAYRDLANQASRDGQVRISGIAKTFIDHIPPSIREAVLADSDFVGKYKLTGSLLIRFRQLGIAFNSPALIGALQQLFQGSSPVTVNDTSNQLCKLQFDDQDRSVPVLVREDDRIPLDEFLMFSTNCSVRVQSFNRVADYYGLLKSQRNEWQQLLGRQVPTGHEFDSIIQDLRDTSSLVQQSISHSILQGDVSVDVIAPTSRQYYARLVGRYDMSETVHAFIQGGLSTVLDDHLECVLDGGIERCLSMAIHPSVVNQIPLHSDVATAFEDCADQIAESGDVVSQVGAIELGMRLLDSVPGIARKIGPLIKAVWNDAVESATSRFAAFHKLFIMIDIRLVQMRVLADCPPFYRRAASLAQAALVQSVFLRCGIDGDALASSVHESRLIFHHLQSLGDMRLEPRWHPGYASPTHFKASMCIRVSRALQGAASRMGRARTEELVGREFADMFDGDQYSSVGLLPSPVEGGIPDIPNCPDESLASLRSALRDEVVRTTSFRAFATTSFFFRVDDVTLCDVLDAMERSLDDLIWGAARADAISVLTVLAMAGGVTRHAGFAERIHSLLLRILHRTRDIVDVGHACEIGLVACCCSSSYGEWQVRVSDWFDALAGVPLDSEQATVLLWMVETVCYLFPELWISCGKSYAAFEAVRHGTS